MHQNLEAVLQKEVSRQEFLQTIGVGIVSLLGLSALLKLTGYKGHGSSAGHGYGGSAYGK